MAGLRLLLLLLLLTSISTVCSSDPDRALRRTLGSLGIDSESPCRLPGVACSPNSLHVTRIRLPSRRLRGSVSASVGLLSSLRELSLPGNRLSGALPSDISACRSLEVLNLRANHLSGPVPRSLSSLSSLRTLDLSSNHFVGDLSFLTNLSNLVNLSLSNNFFSGRVPSSLSSFRNLAFLDLSGNPDLHAIRPVLPPKRRYILEQSKNDPSSSSSSSSIAVAPAPHRHYYNYNNTYGPSPAPSPMPSPPHHRNGHKVRIWILGFVTGVFAGVLSGLLISVFYRMLANCIRGRYRNYGGGPAIFSPMIIKNAEDLAFLEKDDVIASLEVVGRGGCGEVYKAPLPNNPNTIIAIKKIMKRSADGAEPGEEESRLLDKWMRQIRSEIVTVGRIRHRNLLPLLAHVTRPDCHFLVYEFMKNGSLHDVIKKSSQGDLELDWPRRHKIAIGVAAGLEYLHVHHKPHIIHRDLKPANILLDDHMEARIADFGLAKEVPDGNTHMTGSNVAGTCGYIAPEYHQTLKFTTKCDMYSFGVILAVLVIGKFPSDDFFQDTDEMNLVKWLRNVMNSEDPAAVIDPKLKGNGYEEQMLLVLKIACFCTVDDPKERPSSKEVRVMLSQIQLSSGLAWLV